MLHYHTVDSKTLELLKSLQKLPELSNFRLVGGTSLALQYGHRVSVDLDLFGNLAITTDELYKGLLKLGTVNMLTKTKHMLIGTINDIKVDVINYEYPWLIDPVCEDGIILASTKDIAAMKLSAITGRGTKKDFVDLHFLLKEYSLSDIFKFYADKYSDGSQILVLKSLGYFEDAEEDIMPRMFSDLTWDKIKKKIKSETLNYINN